MKVVKMALADLKRPERNVRMHTEKQLKEFERSVSMFGQIRPIVVDENLTILAGNGLYESLLRLGWTEGDVLKMTDLSENQKKKLMLADNRVYSLGVDELNTLDEFLAELKDDLDIPGFDEELLQSMMADASDITDKIGEYGTLDEAEIQQIKEARNRKQQYMEARPSESADAPNAEDGTQADGEREPIGKFVVCPKCGEKIWL